MFFRIFNSIKNYLLLIFLLVVSLFLISRDDASSAAKPKRLFFGAFAFVNSALNSIFIEPLERKTCADAEFIAAKLNLENERLRILGLENAELKELLDYKNKSDYELITAKIISKDTEPTKANFVIDKGELDGVSIGANVINGKGFIGIVTQVSDNSAVVQTFKNSKTRITVQDERTGINGLAVWNGKDLTMKNIPANYDIKRGDRIIVSPLSEKYAPYIPLGLVKEELVSVSGLFADLIIEPFNDLNTVRYCFVISNGGEQNEK